MTKSAAAPPAGISGSLFLRFLGGDKSAAAVAQAARLRAELPVVFLNVSDAGARESSDYTLIDTTLAAAAASLTAPAPGLAYAGFSSPQRAAFLAWAAQPAQAAPAAFQHLLLANAEVRLLAGGLPADQIHAILPLLAAAPPWQGNIPLARTMLLAYWLRQDGLHLRLWLESYSIPAQLWNIALGCQALLAEPLSAEQLPALAAAWRLPVPAASPAVLRLRLNSLQSTLGQEPLAYVLAALGDAAQQPVVWRCQHRDLRLAFPQPNMRPLLEPLLADLLSLSDDAALPLSPSTNAEAQADLPADDAPPPQPGKRTKGSKQPDDPSRELAKAHLILEFGASRSDVFAYVLRQAQKQTGFQQIMDENRHIVYRVPFRRSEMRRFWQLWDYVQNWSSMHVYCEGRELDKWQIYPYSQYLR